MDFQLLTNEAVAYLGGTAVGNTYYTLRAEEYMGLFTVNYLSSWDSSDWTLLEDRDNISKNVLSACTAVDPATQTVYGCFIDARGEGYEFGTVDYTDCTRTRICMMEEPWNAIVIDNNSNIYAVKTDGTLNSVDRTTGHTVPIGDTGVRPQYITGAAYDTRTGRCFWSVCTDSESALYELNLQTAEAIKLVDFPEHYEFAGLYVDTPLAPDKAPGNITAMSVNFTNESLSGNVSFIMPQTLYDGTPGQGILTYNIYAGENLISIGEAHYNEAVTQEITLERPGTYVISVVAENSAGKGPQTSKTLYVGTETPVSPEVVLERTGNDITLHWEPVTEAVSGNTLETSSVTYDVVRYPEEITVAENLMDTSFTETIQPTEGIKVYHYIVTAKFHGQTSSPGVSEAFATGYAQPPYNESFEFAEGAVPFTVINANNDGSTWNWDSDLGLMLYNFSDGEQGDDWLITPGISLKSGNTYKFSFKSFADSNYYTERFEVKMGSSPTAAGMSSELIAPTEWGQTEPTNVECYITPDSDGTYYFGIHAMSDPYMMNLYVDDISISAPISGDAPGPVTDITIIPDYNGLNAADVSFTTPGTTIDNNPLVEISDIVISSKGEILSTLSNPSPATEYRVNIQVTEAGTYSFDIVASNSAGTGKNTTASGYIGIAPPTAPTDIKVVETNHTGYIDISWQAPAVDIYGNPLNPTLVKYGITDGTSMLVENLQETHYAFQAVPEGTQDFVQYAVFAFTEAGHYGAYTGLHTIGTPFAMPYSDSFANGIPTHPLALGESVDDATWDLYTDGDFTEVQSYDEDNGMLGMSGDYYDASAQIRTAKIHINDIADPTLSMFVYNFNDTSDSPNENELAIFVSTDDENFESFADFDFTGFSPGWNKITFPMDNFRNKDVSLMLQGTVKTHTHIFIDKLRVSNLMDYDLAVTGISAPSEVQSGEEFTVKVFVENTGLQQSIPYSVNLLRDGKPVASLPGESLGPDAIHMYSFKESAKVIDPEIITYQAAIECNDDECGDNNRSSSLGVQHILPPYPAATALTASCLDGRVSLSWKAPDLESAAPEQVTEDFEEAEPWAMEFGDWKFVDMDESPIGGFMDIDIPGQIIGETLASFWVFDASGTEWDETFDAHSGNEYLAAMYRADNWQNDDWAISPSLYGQAQTVKFFARSYSEDYPETIEVLYSMEGSDPEDFEYYGMEATEVPAEWTEYRVKLPEGARYFAIHLVSEGAFMLMVDDVTYIPDGASADYAIEGYNVYCNGEKVNDLPIADTSYCVNSKYSEERYVVTVVYDRGESAPSNEATVTNDSAINAPDSDSISIYREKNYIVVENAEGLPIHIFAADGSCLDSATATRRYTFKPDVTGVFIVTVADKSAKIIL